MTALPERPVHELLAVGALIRGEASAPAKQIEDEIAVAGECRTECCGPAWIRLGSAAVVVEDRRERPVARWTPHQTTQRELTGAYRDGVGRTDGLTAGDG